MITRFSLHLTRGLSLQHWPWEAPAPIPHPSSCSAGTAQKRLTRGCHIYGIKQLARSQIRSDEKGCETPCTHKLLCSLTKLALEEPPAIHVLIAWSLLCFTGSHTSKPAVSPCSCGGFQRTPWNQRSSRPAHSPDLYFLRSQNQTTTGLAKQVSVSIMRTKQTINHLFLTQGVLKVSRSQVKRGPTAVPATPGLFAVSSDRFSAGILRSSPLCNAPGWQLCWRLLYWGLLGALCTRSELQLRPTGHPGAGVHRTIPEKALLGEKLQTPVCDRCWCSIFAAERAFGSLGANLKFTPPWPLFIQLCCSAALSVTLCNIWENFGLHTETSLFSIHKPPNQGMAAKDCTTHKLKWEGSLEITALTKER